MSNYTFIGADNYGNACLESADGSRHHVSLDDMHAESVAAIEAEESADNYARAYIRGGSDHDALAAIVSALEAHSHRRELSAFISQ